MISMLALCVTNRAFEALSGQTKDLFMAEHAQLTSQSKYWLYLTCKVWEQVAYLICQVHQADATFGMDLPQM
jgi:hypothetical protein